MSGQRDGSAETLTTASRRPEGQDRTYASFQMKDLFSGSSAAAAMASEIDQVQCNNSAGRASGSERRGGEDESRTCQGRLARWLVGRQGT